ncbi:MAG: C-GCAxxG-C-C family (seleno)protein [Bacillota bacterium]
MSNTEKDLEKIAEFRAQGYGCAQVMLAMGLWKLEEENSRLIEAAKGLCLGCHCESVCGCLSGSICMATMIDREQALEYIIPELSSWFESEYETINCMDILEGDVNNKFITCPPIIEATYLKTKELLKDVGYDF